MLCRCPGRRRLFLLPVGAVPPGPTPASMHNAKYVRRTTVLVLGNHVTRDACRHGGLTELGDAGATEFEGMAASMHKTPQALRLYVKRSEAQRVTAARKRRRLVEGKG